MPRRLFILTPLIAGALVLAAACGGDGGEQVELIPIRHLDFEGVDLTVADYINPPFADQYPEVVAEVNGVPVSGESLARRQVMLELSRRQLLDEFWERFPEAIAQQQLEELESVDLLEALIDDELQRQAAERLGLLPSYEEGVAITREQEETYFRAISQQSPEQRQASLETLSLSGIPPEDWASDPEVVEGYRRGMGLAALRSSECVPATPTIDGLNLASIGPDCTDFLAHERENAEIVYYVRWVD